MKAPMGFDRRLALRIGTDELLEDGTSHRRLVEFKVGIANFKEGGRDFIAVGIKSKYSLKFINSFLKTSLAIVTLTQPILAIRCKRRIREGTKKRGKMVGCSTIILCSQQPQGLFIGHLLILTDGR